MPRLPAATALAGAVVSNLSATVTGLSRATRWRLERAGKFPLRRQLSENSVAWLESEIRGWIASRNVRASATKAAA